MATHGILGTTPVAQQRITRSGRTTTMLDRTIPRRNVRTRWVVLTAIIGLLLSACGSGPSPAALESDRAPTTTTTTEPPPEGITIVIIESGRFRPSNLKLDLNENWIVEWRHEDSAEREYVITARDGEWEDSPLLTPGDTFQVDFRELEPDIYRYFSFIGNSRIPGSIDTRPEQ